MNYLVTGACGQLGCALRLASKGSRDRWLFTDVCDVSPESFSMLRKLGGEAVDVSTARLDVTDENAVHKLLRDNEIDVVINAAAYTAVDAAETHPEEARLLNVEAPRFLANSVRETGGFLVHISTDYVFGDGLLREAGSGIPRCPGRCLGLRRLASLGQKSPRCASAIRPKRHRFGALAGNGCSQSARRLWEDQVGRGDCGGGVGM